MTFEEEIYRQLEERARRHGRSVNDEIRAAVERALALAERATGAASVGNPNQGWSALAESVERLPSRRPDPTLPAVDSEDARRQAARGVYRRSMNREPRW